MSRNCRAAKVKRCPLQPTGSQKPGARRRWQQSWETSQRSILGCPGVTGSLCHYLTVLRPASSSSSSRTQRGSSGHAAGDVPCHITCPEFCSSSCPPPLHSALQAFDRHMIVVVIRAELVEHQWQGEVVVRHQPDGMPSFTRTANEPVVCSSRG